MEILTSYQGGLRIAAGKNYVLTQEQKDHMKMADAGTNIAVKVRYIPENTLKHNDIKELDFSFTVDPENEAQYVGGQEQLQQYLKLTAIDKIPLTRFEKSTLAAVKFTLDEEGNVIDAHVFQSSKDAETDALLLAAIRNMPSWKPAEYANGLKVKQDFVLTVGNMESCVMNLLEIRQD